MKPLLCLCLLFAPAAFGQLTRDQKLQDFQNLAALFAKRYAPYEWKQVAFGYNALDLTPWLPRVEASQDDIEFWEICAEYVAKLDDLHTSFRTGSTFFWADAGFTVDIYDGKPLIDSINRVQLPSTLFPFQVGDEVVSVDGVPAAQFIEQTSKLRRMGNPTTTQRNAADWISFRDQYYIPSAGRLGDTVTFEIRRQSGDVEKYEIAWAKTGIPVTQIGPVPSPKLRTAVGNTLPSPLGKLPEDLDPNLVGLWSAWNWSVMEDEPLLRGTTHDEETGQELPRRYALGWGSRFPTFGLPLGFQIRLGLGAQDFHFSGVYPSGGKRIGYLRIPNFAPSNLTTATRELQTEIAYFKANTDGLVVDVMRNTGGGCYMLTAASYLIPNTFFFFGEQIRPTLDRINSVAISLYVAKLSGAEQWMIDLYTGYLSQIQQAYRENRGLTGPIPACSLTFENEPARDSAGAVLAYDKPLIVLIDEFSTSAGDIFPAMLQDNQRGPLVGTRTNGAGGSTSAWTVGFYSEIVSSNTNSLVVRKGPIATPEYPTAPYIENIGARADIPLLYMTKENLLTRGRPFVQGFTDIILTQIGK